MINYVLEVLTEELAYQSVFASALQVNYFLDLKPELMNNTVSKKTLSSSILNKPTDGRTDLTEGRTFDTETETKLDTNKGKNP